MEAPGPAASAILSFAGEAAPHPPPAAKHRQRTWAPGISARHSLFTRSEPQEPSAVGGLPSGPSQVGAVPLQPRKGPQRRPGPQPSSRCLAPPTALVHAARPAPHSPWQAPSCPRRQPSHRVSQYPQELTVDTRPYLGQVLGAPRRAGGQHGRGPQQGVGQQLQARALAVHELHLRLAQLGQVRVGLGPQVQLLGPAESAKGTGVRSPALPPERCALRPPQPRGRRPGRAGRRPGPH